MATELTLTNVRLNYLHVFEPKLNTISKKEEYSATILLPKSDTENVKRLNAALKAEKRAKWDDDIPEGLEIWIKDGDTDNKKRERKGKKPVKCNAGMYVLQPTSQEQIAVVDRGLNRIITPGKIKNGDYFNISINVYAYDNKFGEGITFYLNTIQFFKAGESLGNAVSPEDVFKRYDDADSDDIPDWGSDDEDDEDDDLLG